MSVISVHAPAMSTCFGDLDASLDAMRQGRRGTQPLADIAGFDVPGVAVVYADPTVDEPYEQRAAAHLRRVLRESVPHMASPRRRRTAVVLCTGLGRTPGDEAELTTREWRSLDDVTHDVVGPDCDVLSITNACSASGVGLAVGVDLLRVGAYDQVLLAAADSMTRSMLTMIGKVAATPAPYCAPFGSERFGAVLGEGAASCLLSTTDVDGGPGTRFGSVRSIECSSDAGHPTAPDARVIGETVRRAIEQAQVAASDLDIVVPHGTGTALNDACESTVYTTFPELVDSACFLPLKGGIGHTSGASFLMSLLTAIAVCRGATPPSYAPTPGDDTPDLRWRPDESSTATLAMVAAYGFGGANAVGVVAA